MSGERVVMRLTQWTQNISAFQEFLEVAVKLGAGPHAKVVYAQDSDGHPCLYVDLPDGASKALKRKRKPKPRTKAQSAVREQLAARKEAVRSGEEVPGHVSPVAKGGKVLKVRVKSKRP